MMRHASKTVSSIRRLQIAVILVAIGVFIYAFAVYPGSTKAEEPIAQSLSENELLIEPDPSAGEQNYSRFPHSNENHSRLPCLLCHRRDDNSSRISFPGKNNHLPCAGCHAVQFSDQNNPICTICHTNPQSGAMKRFPSLKSFSARFDHGRHVRQTNCATCHKQNRRGAGFSVPAGSVAHSSCFQCHTSDNPIGSCNTCHTAGRPTRNSDWAKAYTVNFSHQEHIRKGGMNCTACHTVRAGASKGNQVTAPLASMHFAPANVTSCATCHNNKRAFGPPDFSDCKRCHEGNRFRF